MRIDEHLHARKYLSLFVSRPDGKMWVLTSVLAMLCGLSLLVGVQFIPLRYSSNVAKALVLLIFSPIILFGVLVWLRQMFSIDQDWSEWVLAAICFILFVYANRSEERRVGKECA